MPSSLNLNGLRLFRPAVYADVDASALGGQSPSTGNVCIVGAFPQFKKDEALAFTSASNLVAYDPTDPELALLGKLAFSPSLDERIPAGVASLSFLNVQSSTQAETTLLDTDGGDALRVQSLVYGERGNRATIKAENENTDQLKVTIARDSLEEIYSGIESGDLGSLYYGGSLLSSVSLGATRTSVAISWSQTSAAIAAGVLSVDVSDMSISSALTCSPTESDHNQAISVVIVGVDSDGVAQTETLTYLSGTTTAQDTTHEYSSITSISATTDDATYTGALTLSASISFDPSAFSDLRELLAAIQNLSGFVAVYDAARAYPADEIDAHVSANIVGVGNKSILRADLYEVIQALAPSRIVKVTRASGGTKRVAQSEGDAAVTQRLSGGASSAVALSDWTSALATIEASDVQIVVGWTTDIDQQKALKAHIPLAARAGRERNVWLGSSASQTLTALSSITRQLNDRNIALVGQSINVTKPSGERATLEPRYLALVLAAMQAGSLVGTPLTRKRPDVNGISGSWDANRDAAEAIRAGVVSLSLGSLGHHVERSVTTYRTDDNPIFSEVSANESINASIRTLRGSLDRLIGSANSSLTPNRVTSLVQASLNRQVQDGIIKAFRDVVVQDVGDTLVVGYTVAAVEPLNFIRLDVSVQRF
jgi:hypothetical protein